MNKRLKLNSISSSDIDIDLASWNPLVNEDIFICLDMEISFENDEVNLFYVNIATPEGLRKHEKGFLLSENRTIVISEYNYEALLVVIKNILAKCTRDSWTESCLVLQRYFLWEYEDYSDE